MQIVPVIDPVKLRDYLLSRTHPVGRFKAASFLSLGYSADNWARLEADLRANTFPKTRLLTSQRPTGRST